MALGAVVSRVIQHSTSPRAVSLSPCAVSPSQPHPSCHKSRNALYTHNNYLLIMDTHIHAANVVIIINNFIYRLDAETKGSTRFRIPTAQSCSVPSAARTLLRAGGILNRVDPIGRGV